MQYIAMWSWKGSYSTHIGGINRILLQARPCESETRHVSIEKRTAKMRHTSVSDDNVMRSASVQRVVEHLKTPFL